MDMGLGDDDLVYIEEYRAALVIVDNMMLFARKKMKYLATVKIDTIIASFMIYVNVEYNFHHRRTLVSVFYP